MRADDLAYLIYTSGSTGQPKGVELCHRGVVNFLCSMARVPGFSADDAILALTTLSFDIAVLELLLPITVGGRVVIARRDVAIDPERLARVLEEAGITIVQATPATWRPLVDSGWGGKPDLKILVGGEALPGELAGQLLSRCASLWNMYGPTETTVWSATSRVTSADLISLGRPIANTQLYVLQPGYQLAPLGVPGELFIGGEGLARGYRNRPSLTDEVFVPHPFDPDTNARLYKTGDLVRFRANGALEFLGRSDQQIKIRGYRVEPGEIEAALREHPAVRDAVVVVRPDAHGDKRLVGYIVPAAAGSFPVQELRRHLAAKLPEYMVVSSFVPVDAFPMTASGKIDRRSLPDASQEDASLSGSVSGALTPTQGALVAIWSELLGMGRPGLDDTLFSLGGHSLTAVRLVTMIRQRMSLRLPVMAIFSHPTIRELASVIDARRAGSAEAARSLQAAAATAGESANNSEARRLKFRVLGKRRLGSEHLLRGPLNRVLQMAARAAPGALRPVLHRWRGVNIGEDVLIGYDSIIETSYPWLVSIGSRSAIGMRVTIIGHFLRMEHAFLKQSEFSVEIGDDVWIGPGSLILPNVTIGKGAVVAAGSVVSGSVAPGMMVQGNPARAVARCPIPLRPGMRFEDFVQSLEPLGERDGEPAR